MGLCELQRLGNVGRVHEAEVQGHPPETVAQCVLRATGQRFHEDEEDRTVSLERISPRSLIRLILNSIRSCAAIVRASQAWVHNVLMAYLCDG